MAMQHRVSAVVPLDCLRELRVPFSPGVDLEVVHEAVLPFVRAPHRLVVKFWR